MFNEDRFDEHQDFSIAYRLLGGRQPAAWVNAVIREAYAYLETRYPDPEYRYRFPTLETVFKQTCKSDLPRSELDLLIDTFAYHELGEIPEDYADAVRRLSARYAVGLVIDIWAPCGPWIGVFRQADLISSVRAMSFSSSIGIVKPAPEPFLKVLSAMESDPRRAVVVGDSIRRDLGAAMAACIDCVLVGGAQHGDAIACYPSLLDFVNNIL